MRISAPFVAITAAGFLTLAGGCQSTNSSTAAGPAGLDTYSAFKPGLRAELLDMRAEDQVLRSQIASTPASQRRALFLDILEQNDDNIDRLEQIINKHGWPTISMVGKDGAEAAWLIAQHADQRPEFRERCLGLMQQAADNGEASTAHLAYLVDRVMVEISQEQLYGTQFWDGPNGYGPVPVIDETNVDLRRAEAGLVPMQEYTLAMQARRPGAALEDQASASFEFDDEQ